MYGLAVKVSVSPTIVSIVERFDCRPDGAVREHLALALGVAEADIWPTEGHEEAAA
jgi:ribosome-binding protein aMBF1 (putative translation factor)